MNGQFPHKDFCLPFAIKRRCFFLLRSSVLLREKVVNCVKTKTASIKLGIGDLDFSIWHGILGRSTQIIHKTFHPKHVLGLRQVVIQLGGVFPTLMIPAPAWPGTHRALNDVFSATF